MLKLNGMDFESYWLEFALDSEKDPSDWARSIRASAILLSILSCGLLLSMF